MAPAQVIKCKNCNTLYQGTEGSEFCPQCEAEREKRWKLLKEYLDQNPGASVETLSKETGVSENEIIRFLREGRLVSSEDDRLSYPCESCGEPITVGRFCLKCKSHMAQMLETMVKAINPPEKTKKEAQKVLKNSKMYTADFNKDEK